MSVVMALFLSAVRDVVSITSWISMRDFAFEKESLQFSIIVLYATETLDVSPTGYGVILAVSSLGGLVASFSTAKMRQIVGYRFLVPGALALGAITMIGLFFTTNPYIAGLLLAAYIFHVTVWNILVVSLRQRLVPDEMRGRQNSLFKLIGLIGLVVGAAVAGPIANASGLATPFGIAGLIFVGCAAYTAGLLSGNSFRTGAAATRPPDRLPPPGQALPGGAAPQPGRRPRGRRR